MKTTRVSAAEFRDRIAAVRQATTSLKSAANAREVETESAWVQKTIGALVTVEPQRMSAELQQRRRGVVDEARKTLAARSSATSNPLDKKALAIAAAKTAARIACRAIAPRVTTGARRNPLEPQTSGDARSMSEMNRALAIRAGKAGNDHLAQAYTELADAYMILWSKLLHMADTTSARKAIELAKDRIVQVVAKRNPRASSSKLTLKAARAILDKIGVGIRKKEGEYRVNFKAGREATAYYTNDLEDALNTGVAMARPEHWRTVARPNPPRRRSSSRALVRSTRARRNPAADPGPGTADLAELERAAKRFERFHERDPRKGEVVTVKMKGDAAGLVVGRLVAILYEVKGGEAPFFHRFNKNAKPLLLVSSTGNQAFIVGGRYRLTSRGFVG